MDDDSPKSAATALASADEITRLGKAFELLCEFESVLRSMSLMLSGLSSKTPALSQNRDLGATINLLGRLVEGYSLLNDEVFGKLYRLMNEHARHEEENREQTPAPAEERPLIH